MRRKGLSGLAFDFSSLSPLLTACNYYLRRREY
jgi:hypothetical protein